MKPKTKSVLIISGTLLVGIIIGFLLCGIIVRHRMNQISSLKTKEGFIKGLEKIINPNEEQKEKMKPVYDRVAKEYAELTRKYRKDLQLFADSLYHGLKPVLNENQIERLDKKMKLSSIRNSKTKTADSVISKIKKYNSPIDDRAEVQTKWIDKSLNLSPEKVKSVYEISLKYNKIQQWIINNGRTRFAVARKLRLMNEEREKELKEILTEEEFKIYQEKKDEIISLRKERQKEKRELKENK